MDDTSSLHLLLAPCTMNILLIITIGFIHLLAFSMGAMDTINEDNNRTNFGLAGKVVAKAVVAAKFAAVDKEGIIHNPFLDEKPTYLFKETRGFINPTKNYSKEVSPEGTKVSVDITIRGISKVDTDAETISMSMKLGLSWTDSRLNWPKGGPSEGKAFNIPSNLLR